MTIGGDTPSDFDIISDVTNAVDENQARERERGGAAQT
jgi:hypothetical protein